MMTWITNVATACWLRTTCADRLELIDNQDPLLWTKDHGTHSCGQYSFAVCQANAVLEDFSQVETGANAILVGIYDGHGGPEAAQFVRNNLFNEIIQLTRANGNMSHAILRTAILNIDNRFLEVAKEEQGERPMAACVGTCCLLGVIWKGLLILAHVGDSRAVLGYVNHENRVIAQPLTQDHNVNDQNIRAQLTQDHPDDPEIVIFNNGAFRVKGVIQVSKAIGDGYLKSAEFAPHPSLERFQLNAPIQNQPAITSDPTVMTRIISNSDRFMIFASDGLWDCLPNQKAVEIVNKYPRHGIARRLIKAAQINAGKRAGLRFGAVHSLERGPRRREVHDDISVVVVFIDHTLLGHKIQPTTSTKGFDDVVTDSAFATIDDLM